MLAIIFQEVKEYSRILNVMLLTYFLTQGYFHTRKCGTIYKKKCIKIENGGGLKVCICDNDNCNKDNQCDCNSPLRTKVTTTSSSSSTIGISALTLLISVSFCSR